jgi:hypothetical protein
MIRWSKAGEMSGDWRQFHNEKLHGLYSAPSIIIIIIIIIVIEHRTVRWTGHAARREIEIYIQDVSGRPERKRLIEDIRRKWDIVIIKIDLKAIRREEDEWINLIRNTYRWVPVVETVMNTWIS